MGALRVAVFGDIHGKQDLMYETAQRWEDEHKKSIDVVLQVGDFETIRNLGDLNQYYAPQRHHKMSDFAGYYDGSKQAPYFTIFTGGNHEAWGVLADHNKGGFVCSDVYYLGRSGALDYKGVKIAGLTGLFNPEHYKTPLPPEPDRDWQYYRKEDVQRLLDENSVDILLLHQWLRPISKLRIRAEENVPRALKADRISAPTLQLISGLKPTYVFMGHIHGSYVDGTLGKSNLVGLPEVNNPISPRSFLVVECPPSTE